MISTVRRCTSRSTRRSPPHTSSEYFSSYRLSAICLRCCAPTMGPEFLGETFTQWAKTVGMAIQYIQPGKPNQNAYIERFNRTLREDIFDAYLFARLDDV